MNHLRGVALVERCQEHLLEVMRSLPECDPGGCGLRHRDLVSAAGFAVVGDQRDTWFVAALLGRLEISGRIEVFASGVKSGKRFRLKSE